MGRNSFPDNPPEWGSKKQKRDCSWISACAVYVGILFYYPSLVRWTYYCPRQQTWATSAGYHQFQVFDVERQFSRLTEGNKRKSRTLMYDIKIMCQKMLGQCLACPLGRAVAGIMEWWPSYNFRVDSHSSFSYTLSQASTSPPIHFRPESQLFRWVFQNAR